MSLDEESEMFEENPKRKTSSDRQKAKMALDMMYVVAADAGDVPWWNVGGVGYESSRELDRWFHGRSSLTLKEAAEDAMHAMEEIASLDRERHVWNEGEVGYEATKLLREVTGGKDNPRRSWTCPHGHKGYWNMLLNQGICPQEKRQFPPGDTVGIPTAIGNPLGHLSIVDERLEVLDGFPDTPKGMEQAQLRAQELANIEGKELSIIDLEANVFGTFHPRGRHTSDNPRKAHYNWRVMDPEAISLLLEKENLYLEVFREPRAGTDKEWEWFIMDREDNRHLYNGEEATKAKARAAAEAALKVTLKAMKNPHGTENFIVEISYGGEVLDRIPYYDASEAHEAAKAWQEARPDAEVSIRSAHRENPRFTEGDYAEAWSVLEIWETMSLLEEAGVHGADRRKYAETVWEEIPKEVRGRLKHILDPASEPYSREFLSEARRMGLEVRAEANPPKKPIIVVVRGGALQDVEWLPAGWSYRLIDWDNIESGDPKPKGKLGQKEMQLEISGGVLTDVKNQPKDVKVVLVDWDDIAAGGAPGIHNEHGFYTGPFPPDIQKDWDEVRQERTVTRQNPIEDIYTREGKTLVLEVWNGVLQDIHNRPRGWNYEVFELEDEPEPKSTTPKVVQVLFSGGVVNELRNQPKGYGDWIVDDWDDMADDFERYYRITKGSMDAFAAEMKKKYGLDAEVWHAIPSGHAEWAARWKLEPPTVQVSGSDYRHDKSQPTLKKFGAVRWEPASSTSGR